MHKMQLQGDLAGVFSQISNLIDNEIPSQQTNLSDNVTNLEKVAQYCEDIYVNSREPDKQHLLNETKSYTSQALASVAYQIHVLANSFLQLLANQSVIIDDIGVTMSHLSHEVNIHKEKVARREIGVLTTNKTIVRTSKIKKPEVEERSTKYVRKPIDYSVLDDIGHGVRLSRQSSNLDPLAKIGVGRQNSYSSTHSGASSNTGSTITAANIGNGMNTIRSTNGSVYHRTPVAPPAVPSEYLSRQELGIYSSKKELNQSAGADSLSVSYGGPMSYRRQLSSNQNSSNNEYSGTETLDRRMTSNYLQHLNYAMAGNGGTIGPSSGISSAYNNMNNSLNTSNNPNNSVGYATGKEIGMIRTNLNNIDYATNSTMYRRPQLHNPTVYGQQQQQQQQNLMMMMPPPPPLTTEVGAASNIVDNQDNTNLLRISTNMHQQQQQQAMNTNPILTASMSNSGLPPPPPAFFGAHDDDNDDELVGGDDDDDIIPNWVPIERCLEKVLTTYDYEGLRDDELSFKENMFIYVIKKNDDHWYEGIMQTEDGRIINGLYPYNYARVVRKYVNDDPRISEC